MTSMNEHLDTRIRTWSQYHAWLLLATAPLVWWGQRAEPLAALALLSFILYIIWHADHWRTLYPWGGYANWISALRLAGVLAIGFGYAIWPMELTAGMALGIVCLDGVDGYLARRYRTTSTFGAYLDMETDALYVGLLSAVAYSQGLLPAPILLIGYMRYLYMAAMTFLGAGQKPEPRSRFGQTVAVLMMLALATVFVLPPVLYKPLVGGASLLILYSFGQSFCSRCATY